MTDIAAAAQGQAPDREEDHGSSQDASITQIAGDTVRNVKEELAGLVEDVSHQASDRFVQQRETAAKAMTVFAAAIRKAGQELAQHDQSLAARMIKQAADGLEDISRSVMNKKPEELLDAGRQFGRDNPVAFGAAAVLAGLAVGRFLRSSEGHRPASSSPLPSVREPATHPLTSPTGAAAVDSGADIPPTWTAPSHDTLAPVQTGAAAVEQSDALDSPTSWRA